MGIKNLSRVIRATFLLNRIVAFLLKLFHIKSIQKRWPIKGILSFKILNTSIRFYSDCDDHLVSKYYYTGFDEEVSEIEFIQREINNVDVFFDIGSYNGLFSIFLGKMNPDMKIFAFEPNPSNYKRIIKNIEINGLKNVNVFNHGISNENGSLDFYLPIDKSITTVSSFTKSFYLNHSNTKAIKEKVPVQSLDAFCKHYNIFPQIIKIDVEGHEYEVFKGARKTIETYKPTILCEIFTKSFENDYSFKSEAPITFYINSFFKEMNYTFNLIENGQLAKVDSLNTSNPGRNFLLIPQI